MLDIILIQHIETGLNLLEYRQEDTKFNMDHSDIFSGFLNAAQSIMAKELDIGTVVLISTKGTKGHNCIIVSEPPISVILLCDQDDPIDHWREIGQEIAEQFLDRYGKDFIPNKILQFKDFQEVIKEMCTGNKYCE